MTTATHADEPVRRVENIDPVTTARDAVIDNQLNDNPPGSVATVGNVLRHWTPPGAIAIHPIPRLATVTAGVPNCDALLVFDVRFGS